MQAVAHLVAVAAETEILERLLAQPRVDPVGEDALVGAAELARARKLLAKGEAPEAVLEALAKGLTQKMLHGTLAELRSADPAHREQTMQAVQRLFLRQER